MGISAPISRRDFIEQAAASVVVAATSSTVCVDPAEYIDRLRSLGVCFFQWSAGRWLEQEPEQVDPTDQDTAYRLREFWLATSERRSAIVAELDQRFASGWRGH